MAYTHRMTASITSQVLQQPKHHTRHKEYTRQAMCCWLLLWFEPCLPGVTNQPSIHDACRLTSPVILRQYLTWLQRTAVAPPGTPVWPGWCWALGVAAGGMAMTLVHHQFFW